MKSTGISFLLAMATASTLVAVQAATLTSSGDSTAPVSVAFSSAPKAAVSKAAVSNAAAVRTAVPNAVAARTAGTCADVLLVGATGSGESASARTNGYGRTVAVFRDAYAAQAAAGERTLEDRSVNYAPEPVKKLRSRSSGFAVNVVTKSRIAAWTDGVGTAVAKTTRILRSAEERCPDQQIVLAGYAQGAMVMHRSLIRLAGEKSIVGRVVGAALVADGDRNRRSRAQHLLGNPAAPRAGVGVHTRFLKPVADVPTRESDVAVWNICTKSDIACDIGRTSVKKAARIHRSYGAGAGAAKVRAAAEGMWRRTTYWPVPTPRETEIGAEVGVALTHQLAVDVRRSAVDSVRWRRADNVPPGLRLTADGLISGIPTSAGTWRLTYVVRNTAKAAFDRPVPGIAVITVRPASAAPVIEVSPTLNLSAGGTQTCEVRADRSAWCWGRNNWGQLGDGTTIGRLKPVRVGLPDDQASNWASISTSGSTTCGTRTTGAAWCWGLNNVGQLGDGTATRRVAPVQVGSSKDWATISTSWFHTCATKADRSLWCWGNNDKGQLGDGSVTRRNTPTRVGTGSDWAEVTTGGWHTCATKADGTAWCWGENLFGQLGIGTLTAARHPTQVGTGTDWKQLSASWSNTCGVVGANEARCWGANNGGQIGDGTTVDRRYPNTVQTDQKWTSIAVGDAHTCATATDGSAWCWGENVYGQLGDGTRARRTTPVQVVTAGNWAQLTASWYHTCGLLNDGSRRCWGNNENGQIGDGTAASRPAPVTPVS